MGSWLQGELDLMLLLLLLHASKLLLYRMSRRDIFLFIQRISNFFSLNFQTHYLSLAISCLQNNAVVILTPGHCRSLSKGSYNLS
jgi:hypothetical protein